jgi:peroxiredoxin
VKLAAFKGKKVLLSFRPLAWTPVCQDQMRSLEEHYDYLLGCNVTPLGVGVDSPYSNKAWASHLGIARLRLLSDFWPHGEIAKAFGVFREKDGFSERANFILDEQQKVIFARVYPIAQVPEIHEIIDFLKE